MAVASVSRSIVKKVLAVETPEGAGALVRRSIGSMTLRNLSPFLMLGEYIPFLSSKYHLGDSQGFPDHPHRGQATVTYMLEGTSRHEDSAGHKGTIETGGVQWMCAGKGIIHAEMPVHEEGLPDPKGMQLWIDLPKEHKMVDPSYQELGPNEIPSAYPEGPEGPVKIKVISGKSHGVESPVRHLGGCWYFHLSFSKKGTTVFQDIPEGWTAFIYIWKGSVIVGNDSLPAESFHTLVLSANEGETGVKMISGDDDTHFILVAGEPLNQTIQKTLMDYQMGKNGFEKAHSWQSEIGKQ
ncbi:RmlC-like cupin domain-containing protein [Lentinula guzmanii]|uniref:RmlC-like cupin domain-containing protein n=1 Tax=Lentinula guzmanii TaxID=2804957 RepID=A0AA38JPI6_9AGAR|nr:RmlC-like cupin domain-containing protein [Lentinula guzmanii]